MKKIIHRSDERGYFDHGWLKTYHSFSFASWYNPQKMHFGKLRVLNDDTVEPGEGFGTHPHENMEIVSIPLRGFLAHKDSMNHEEIIKPNEVQVMSAGTGILHSEYNSSQTDPVSFLQIWIFPDTKGHTPRYDQKAFDPNQRKNKWQIIVSPNKVGEALWLNQDSYLCLCSLDKEKSIIYETHSHENGIYIFNIEGKINASDEILSKRDALGIWEENKIEISAEEESYILVIEVPMG